MALCLWQCPREASGTKLVNRGWFVQTEDQSHSPFHPLWSSSSSSTSPSLPCFAPPLPPLPFPPPSSSSFPFISLDQVQFLLPTKLSHEVWIGESLTSQGLASKTAFPSPSSCQVPMVSHLVVGFPVLIPTSLFIRFPLVWTCFLPCIHWQSLWVCTSNNTAISQTLTS